MWPVEHSLSGAAVSRRRAQSAIKSSMLPTHVYVSEASEAILVENVSPGHVDGDTNDHFELRDRLHVLATTMSLYIGIMVLGSESCLASSAAKYTGLLTFMMPVIILSCLDQCGMRIAKLSVDCKEQFTTQ